MNIDLIERIIYFEDLLLRRVGKLLEAGDIATSFELIQIADKRMPGYPPVATQHRKLLIREAQLKQEANEPELAMAQLEDAKQLGGSPEVEAALISDTYGRIIDPLIKAASDEERYRKAQYLINRCESVFPRHPISTKWSRELRGRSDEHLTTANKLYADKDYPGAAAEAAEANRIWAVTEPKRRAAYDRALSRFQQLHVGVLDGDTPFPVKTNAAKRHERLAVSRLFEPRRADTVTYYDTDFFEQYDPEDLGRQVKFTLRANQPYWRSLPTITAPAIVDTIRARMEPGNSHYNERFASYIDSYLVRSPTEFEVRFTRPPVRLEALFAFPVLGNGKIPMSQVFQKVESDQPNQTVFRRTRPEPDGLQNAQYHVAEVIEHKYKYSHQALQALLRGEVDMVPHVPPAQIDSFRNDPKKFFIRKYAIPWVHVIQFNPKSKVLENVQLRRALSISINRKRILDKAILKESGGQYGRVVSAPWPTSSFANSSLVTMPDYSLGRLRAAAALVASAEMIIPEKKEGDPPPKEGAPPPKIERKPLPILRLVVEDDSLVKAGAKEIIKFWEAVGFRIEIVESTDDPAAWDLVYHRVRMIEPTTEVWSFLTLQKKAVVDGLGMLPDWLKQEVVDLDFTSKFPTAEHRMRELHRHLAAQGFFVPLWEVDDHAIFSTKVRGFSSDDLVTPYQEIAKWSVLPGQRQ